jgi:uncharacterized protein YdeI (YjbR/CyaY-like superfamily)
MTELFIPGELSAELRKNKAAHAVWSALAPSHQREHAKYVAEAKQAETRQRRAAKTIEALLRTAS